jgi:hypothetical protein
MRLAVTRAWDMGSATDRPVTVYLGNAVATSGGTGPGLVTISEREAAPLASGAASHQPPPFGEVPGVSVSANPKRPR